MKHFFKSSLAILIGLSLTLTACKKDDSGTENNNSNNNGVQVSETQKSTLIYFGGTWCPPCGAYGKPAKEKIHNEVPDKAVIVSCQVDGSTPDPMSCADGNTLIGMFAPSGVPAMYFGAADQPFAAMIGGSSSTGTTAVAKVNEQAALSPIVNMALTVKEQDGFIIVSANGKFFKDATGDYYVAGYMLEDKLNYTQASDGSVEKNIHYNVLRTKFGTSVTGELVKTDPKAGDTFTKDLGFFPDTKYVKANLGFAIIVWKKASTGWTISNSSYIHFK